MRAFFRQVEPSGEPTTSLKALHKALRPGQPAKGSRKPEDAARDAGDAGTRAIRGDAHER